MVQKFSLGGRAAWLKRYDPDGWFRPAATRAWNRLAARLDLAALRAPPRYAGEAAKGLEWRRLEALRACGAPVPRVLGDGPRSLILSDMGPTLAHRLKRLKSANDADMLVRQTAHAIGRLHRQGGYLGQAVARNITVGDGGVGFIDFEEDPSEIMSLAQAQARDWVLFTTGVGPYFTDRVDTLGALIREQALQAEPAVADEVQRIARRLGALERVGRFFGRKAAALGAAVGAMRKGFSLVMLGTLLGDLLGDGDLDLWIVAVRIVEESVT
ncbi:serine/threonine protein phosphatase [Luteibacter sp. PPL201]|uniref:Serine/threonine protein phosphatase n=1 Tax=Luteibacter sahnii TaxID=3021977 RepID=A0ABT6BEX1_9GAMM